MASTPNQSRVCRIRSAPNVELRGGEGRPALQSFADRLIIANESKLWKEGSLVPKLNDSQEVRDLKFFIYDCFQALDALSPIDAIHPSISRHIPLFGEPIKVKARRLCDEMYMAWLKVEADPMASSWRGVVRKPCEAVMAPFYARIEKLADEPQQGALEEAYVLIIRAFCWMKPSGDLDAEHGDKERDKILSNIAIRRRGNNDKWDFFTDLKVLEQLNKDDQMPSTRIEYLSVTRTLLSMWKNELQDNDEWKQFRIISDESGDTALQARRRIFEGLNDYELRYKIVGTRFSHAYEGRRNSKSRRMTSRSLPN